MGSLLVSRVASLRPEYFTGLILCVPWLDNYTKISGFQKSILNIACIFAGNVSIPMSKDLA